MMTTAKYLRLSFLILFVMLLGRASAQYNFAELDKVLNQKKWILGRDVSVLIYKDNNLVYQRNFGKYDTNTVEAIASCSKWFTAALAMTFVEEGKLSLNDNICKYLPEFSKDGKEYIKVKHCLSHTSGIESEPISFSSLMERRKYKSLAEEVADFATKPMVGEPGKVFAYSTIGLNTVARILEVISGKDFETLFQERIARPLGMASTTFNNGKVVNPSGGAASTASDYMKFLVMILNKGEYNGKQILSPNSVATMQVSQTVGAKTLYVPDGAEGFEYALGEWVQQKDKNGKSLVVSSPGLFGTYPVVDNARNYAAIVFVKNLKFKNRKETYTAILDAINHSLDNR
jgi:Beta-lactamase class C and other penicillin binding proteins